LLISEFKNGHNLVTGKVMSQVLARRYKQNIKDRPAPHLLLPVPLHKKRLKLRGFNQAIEISQVIGDICQIPTNTKICTRIKDTQDQKSLTAKERKGNINHAFAVNRDLDGYRIAIIDDVITTGTTVASLAGLLIKRGAISVEVIALARTPLR
jgi:ComF family protein